MMSFAAVLSDEDMRELAEVFSGRARVRSTAKTDPGNVGPGKKFASEVLAR